VATGSKDKPQGKKPYYWLIYIAALVAGALLIADAAGYAPLQKITARLGAALLYSAFALLVAAGRPSGIIATVLVWIAVVLTLAV